MEVMYKLSKKRSCEVNELENKVESAFNQKIFKIRMQVLVGSKTKSYQIQRGLFSTIYLLMSTTRFFHLQYLKTQLVLIAHKSFIIFVALLVLIIRMCKSTTLLVDYSPQALLSSPLLIDNYSALYGLSVRIPSTDSLLSYLVITYQIFFYQALLSSTLLIGNYSTVTFTHQVV